MLADKLNSYNNFEKINFFQKCLKTFNIVHGKWSQKKLRNSQKFGKKVEIIKIDVWIMEKSQNLEKFRKFRQKLKKLPKLLRKMSEICLCVKGKITFPFWYGKKRWGAKDSRSDCDEYIKIENDNAMRWQNGIN